MKEKNEKSPTLQCLGSDNVLRLLDPLKSSPAGNVVFKQVAHVLREVEHTQDKISRGYASVLHSLLGVFRQQLPKDSLLYLELRLVQKRLHPPITLSELATLQTYIEHVAQLMGRVADPDEKLLQNALSPLLEDFSGDFQTTAPEPVAGPPLASLESPSPDETEISNGELDRFDEGKLTASAEIRISSLYRQRLDQQRQDFEALQNKLASKVFETVRQQEKFGLLLEVILGNLKQAASKEDVEEVRYYAVQEVEKMLASQNLLVRMLNDTQAFLHLVRKNSEKLSEELKQVRVLSLTDELTELPNRRAFRRRLEDEIGRAERYESQLSIAILDLDNFKQINDSYGHAVGDDMLRLFAKEVLTIFRHHDMVSRYGGEEFAVLLPNTSEEGSLRALQKVRNKAIQTFYDHDGETIQTPTFSAGVAVYHPGETAESLINRADELLYLAKQERDCVRVAEPANDIDIPSE